MRLWSQKKEDMCLAKTLKSKNIEAEMIRYFELSLHQARERRTKKKWRWLNVFSWPCTRLVKTERRRVHRRFAFLSEYISQPSLSLSFTSLFCTFRNKKKGNRLYSYTWSLLSVISGIQQEEIQFYDSKFLLRTSHHFPMVSPVNRRHWYTS